MGKKYLIDTNVVLDFMGDKMPYKAQQFISKVIDDLPRISVINKIELLGFTRVDKSLIDFVNCSLVYNLNDEIVDQVILIRKQNKIKLPDAIIAATALIYDLEIITRNVKDFKGIKHIVVVDPFSL